MINPKIVPKTIDEATFRAAEAELIQLIKGYPSSEFYIDSLLEDYKPLGTSKNTVVIPLKTSQDGYPLCVKFGRSSTGKIIEYPLPSNPYTISYISREIIECNREALVQLELGIVVPPQAFTENKGHLVQGMITPDLSSRRQLNVRDISELEEGEFDSETRHKYEEILEKLKQFDINVFNRHHNLEEAVKHMLFLVGRSRQKFLATGDLDHFAINYGRCYNCSHEGPIMKVTP